MSQFSDRLPDQFYLMRGRAATIVFVLYVWGFIEPALLRGTSHPNRYGPNPLGKTHMSEAATATVGRAPRRAGISRASSISCRTKLVHPRCDVLSETHE